MSSNQQQNDAVNVVASTDEQQQQLDEPWQLQRGNGNAHKIGQYHDGGGNRNYNRGGSNNFNQQQRRGTRNYMNIVSFFNQMFHIFLEFYRKISLRLSYN